MSELPGLQRDPVYLSLSEPERSEYEARYRKTFAGAFDEVYVAAGPLRAEARRLINEAECHIGQLRDSRLRRWFRDAR